MQKFTDNISKLLKNKTNSTKVYLFNDRRSKLTEEFNSMFYESLKQNFTKVVLCNYPSVVLPGEIISYFLNINSPETFIFSFDGGMSFISKLLGCKNSFYLELPTNFSSYFFHKETYEMIKEQTSIYSRLCKD